MLNNFERNEKKYFGYPTMHLFYSLLLPNKNTKVSYTSENTGE